MRGTGGNRIHGTTMTRTEFLSAVLDGLLELEDYAKGTGRVVDYGAVGVETTRTRAGNISLEVSGDLARQDTPA